MKNFSLRIGHGIDAHSFTFGKPLILGGVSIPFEKGLEGHSDADVVIHAIIDALLGAAGLGDIGTHFPNTDPQYRNISSIVLLEKVVNLIQKRHYYIGNVDVTVIAEHPKIAPYFAAMQQSLAAVMKIPQGSISIKATTTEKMGFTGREEGIAAFATALIGY
ncbi:MAG TPA: 2-C-methyl-D-erythritol 2,4-cyclodiphosphate synthase [Candidatus Marinimicrobia bacterium]|nr:2-C-methyl-D-erythritol 2,4-cyclodiphosphate synthase [Candidatus Neomarinimicrobiota bacterium]